MRRIADLRVDLVAALVLHAQAQPCGAGGYGIGDAGIDAVVVGFHVAEVFVVMFLAVGQLGFAQRYALAGLEFHAAAVEVVVLRDRPVQLQYAGRRCVGTELVGLGDGQQVGGVLRERGQGGEQQAQADQQMSGHSADGQRTHCATGTAINSGTSWGCNSSRRRFSAPSRAWVVLISSSSSASLWTAPSQR